MTLFVETLFYELAYNKSLRNFEGQRINWISLLYEILFI